MTRRHLILFVVIVFAVFLFLIFIVVKPTSAPSTQPSSLNSLAPDPSSSVSQ